jgi:hypothetical protein
VALFLGNRVKARLNFAEDSLIMKFPYFAVSCSQTLGICLLLSLGLWLASASHLQASSDCNGVSSELLNFPGDRFVGKPSFLASELLGQVDLEDENDNSPYAARLQQSLLSQTSAHSAAPAAKHLLKHPAAVNGIYKLPGLIATNPSAPAAFAMDHHNFIAIVSSDRDNDLKLIMAHNSDRISCELTAIDIAARLGIPPGVAHANSLHILPIIVSVENLGFVAFLSSRLCNIAVSIAASNVNNDLLCDIKLLLQEGNLNGSFISCVNLLAVADQRRIIVGSNDGFALLGDYYTTIGAQLANEDDDNAHAPFALQLYWRDTLHPTHRPAHQLRAQAFLLNSQPLRGKYSPDGRNFVAMLEDGSAHLYQLILNRGWIECKTFACNNNWQAATFSPDGQRIMLVDKDNHLYLYEIRSEILHVLAMPRECCLVQDLFWRTSDGLVVMIDSQTRTKAGEIEDAPCMRNYLFAGQQLHNFAEPEHRRNFAFRMIGDAAIFSPDMKSLLFIIHSGADTGPDLWWFNLAVPETSEADGRQLRRFCEDDPDFPGFR